MPVRPLLPVTAALVLLLAACSAVPVNSSTASADGGGRIRLLTSTSMWSAVARAVGGDAVEATALLDDPGLDPHEYEATPRDQLAALHADVILVNGGGYDDFLRRLAKPVRTARLVDITVVSRRTTGTDFNEHLWYDLPTVARVAESLRSTFTALRPAERAGFTARTDRFLAGVHALEERARALRPRSAGRSAALTEPLAGYLLTAAGLRIATPAAFSESVEATGEVAPAVLLQQLRLLTGRRVVVLAADTEVTSGTVQRTIDAARAAGIPVLAAREILPPGTAYLPWMRSQLAVLARAVQA